MGALGGGLGALDLDAEDVAAAGLLGVSLGNSVALGLKIGCNLSRMILNEPFS